MGRTLPAPAASAQAPSTGQLFPHRRGVAASSLGSAWDFGAQSHIPRLWPPFSALCRLTSGKAALYTPTASCLHSPPCAVVGPPQPRRVRSRGSLLPPCPSPWGPLWAPLWKHHPATHLSCGSRFFGAPGRWLGPSCPRPPSFYLCWCLQFGVGSLGRQLRPVLAERCCLSLCGWTRLSLAPPRTL